MVQTYQNKRTIRVTSKLQSYLTSLKLTCLRRSTQISPHNVYQSNYTKFYECTLIGRYLVMWVGSTIVEYVTYNTTNKVEIHVHYSYIQADTRKFGCNYTPCIIHKTHHSSQHYSHETLFTMMLSTKNTIHNSTTIENTDIIHNILTILISISFFLFLEI